MVTLRKVNWQKKGGEHHDEAEHAGAGDVQRPTREAAHGEHDGEHAGHVQGVVTGQEDVGHAGEAGEHDVEHHAQGHDDGRSLTKVGEGHGNHGLVVGNHALHVEGVVEQLAKGEQGAALQEGCTSGKYEETNDGFDGAAYDVLHGLLLKHETEEGEKTNEDSRGRQNVDDKVEHCHGLSPFCLLGRLRLLLNLCVPARRLDGA